MDSVSVRESHDVRMREFHRSLVSKKLTMRLLNSLTKSGNFPGRGVESQFSERWRVKWVRAGLRNDEKKKRREWNQTRLFSFSIFHSIRTETHWIERGKEYQNEEATSNYFFLRGKYKRIFECATLKSAVSSNPCTFLIITTKKVEEIARMTADYKRISQEFPLHEKKRVK